MIYKRSVLSTIKYTLNDRKKSQRVLINDKINSKDHQDMK